MDKKEILIGSLVGFAANFIGLVLVGFLMAKFYGRSDGVYEVLKVAGSENFIGKLISLGAILNLICFFFFLRKNQEVRAAGVLTATVLIAVFTFLIKL
jgi:hypothetical protein